MIKGFNQRINIGKKIIGIDCPAFIVAEAGVNHFGKINLAKKLIDMAKEAEADAVKFQVYKSENLISEKEAPDWFKRMKSKELSYDEFRELNKYCLHKKILFFATAHDEESLDFLDKLGVPLYKIGSGEICNHQFLRSVARKHKPVLISTGMYTQRDIESALRIFHEEKNRDIILLHCITAYPAHPQELNLKVIPALRKKFKIAMGYSDHTLGNEMAYAAIALGACVIEKHITIRKNVPYAQDWIVSCDRQGLKDLVSNIRKIEQAMGSGKKNPSAREKENKKWARKSIVAKVDIKGGTKIKENMLCFKRPGTGISPVLADKIIGRRCLAAVEKDDLIKVDNLEK